MPEQDSLTSTESPPEDLVRGLILSWQARTNDLAAPASGAGRGPHKSRPALLVPLSLVEENLPYFRDESDRGCGIDGGAEVWRLW